ncbi:hypothetical protein WA158_005585 [Blastocystis sp. Blastoise]
MIDNDHYAYDAIIFALYTIYKTQKNKEKPQKIPFTPQQYYKLINYSNELKSIQPQPDSLFIVRELFEEDAFYLCIQNIPVEISSSSQSSITPDSLYLQPLLDQILNFPYISSLEYTLEGTNTFTDSIASIIHELPKKENILIDEQPEPERTIIGTKRTRKLKLEHEKQV